MLWSQLQFQDATSLIMTALINFHNSSMITITMIMTYVALSALSFSLPSLPSISPSFENHELEVIWTILPGLILMMLAIPSLRLLYLMEETVSPAITVKVTGHQWYWSYEYPMGENLEFESFILPDYELTPGELRLLEVDNRMILPWGLETRLLITAADVLHSWTVPSLGIKADATPGRLNQLLVTPSKPGVFYGQCSEICGANHSFMPIAVEVIPHAKWVKWVGGISLLNTYIFLV